MHAVDCVLVDYLTIFCLAMITETSKDNLDIASMSVPETY